MLEDTFIQLTKFNDFIFCPMSIYYRNIYDNIGFNTYKGEKQIVGTYMHKRIDSGEYSSNKDILSGIDVYSEQYGLIGKIDVYDAKTRVLTERKTHISHIYDGQIMQVYGQYYCLTEMGYLVEKIIIHSLDDNKNYDIDLPCNNPEYKDKFFDLLKDIKDFKMDGYAPSSEEKCKTCVYNAICDRSLYVK